MDPPLQRAFDNPRTALHKIDAILKVYFSRTWRESRGARTSVLPTLERELVADAMREYHHLTTAPEIQVDELTTRVSQQVIEGQGEFRRQYISKGRCPTGKMLITKRADTTDMSLEGIAKSASPDQILADRYAPSCAYCKELKGKKTVHQTVLSSMRYLSAEFAARLDTIDKHARNRDVLIAKEGKLRLEGQGGTHTDEIREYKATIRDLTAELYDAINDAPAEGASFSTNVRGSQHPAIGIILHAAREFLLTEQEEEDEAKLKSPYSLTIVTRENWADSIKAAGKMLSSAGAELEREGRLVRYKSDLIPEFKATYGRNNTPLAVRIMPASSYIKDRAGKLHEERQIDLIKRARQHMQFAKLKDLLEEYGGL